MGFRNAVLVALKKSMTWQETHRPLTAAELCTLVRAAAAEGRAVYPRGGGTLFDLGPPPARPGYVVHMTGLHQVIDYPARDMTVTVQAGITIARLAEVLGGEGQRLPVDVPRPDQATLGGAVAANVSGPRRYGFGTLRDYVIGISVVNDLGEEVKAGGRVVKNVAGYDLCKLFTGSFGTLGIITQLTLKVRPIPEASTLLKLPCPVERLGPVLDALSGSETRPVCLSALAEGDQDGCVYIGFEESAETVAWQVRQLESELAKAGLGRPEHRDGAAAEPHWRRLTDFPLDPPGDVVFKANVLPRDVAAFCQQARPYVARLLAHAGNGIVFGRLRDPVTRDDAASAIDGLRARAVASQGNLVLLRCPLEWRARLKPWGEPRSDWALMQAVKHQLDPAGIFNPGVFVGGI